MASSVNDPRAAPGPAELLRLAILGTAVRGPVEVEDLIADVQTMGGRYWRPTVEVIGAGIHELAKDGALRIEPIDRLGASSVVHSTDRGCALFEALMEREIEGVPEPVFHSLMLVKIALVDILPVARRWRHIAALIDRLGHDLGALRDRKRNSAHRRPSLRHATRFEESRLENEILWLSTFGEILGCDAPSGRAARLGTA